LPVGLTTRASAANLPRWGRLPHQHPGPAPRRAPRAGLALSQGDCCLGRRRAARARQRDPPRQARGLRQASLGAHRALHGRAGREQMQSRDPRILPAPPHRGQAGHSRPRRLHAEAAHHP